MKTPEEMAEEYVDQFIFGGEYRHIVKRGFKDAFLAGYQAAKDQLADADKVMADDDRFVSREMPMWGLGSVKWSRTDAVGDSLNKSAAKHALRALDKKTPPQWISVKERLPEHGIPVLVFDTLANTIELVSWDKIMEEFSTDDALFIRLEDASHWMPLPEAPKGEE